MMTGLRTDKGTLQPGTVIPDYFGSDQISVEGETRTFSKVLPRLELSCTSVYHTV